MSKTSRSGFATQERLNERGTLGRFDVLRLVLRTQPPSLPIAFAKSNFRNGGANLLVCYDSQQGIATILEITFGNWSN